MPKEHRNGFTLIELLVVIAILGLLVAAFAPDIYNSLMGGQKAADKRHLQRLYEWMIIYEQKHKTMPRNTGSKFILDLWVSGIPQRTEQNFEVFWTPGLQTNDPRYQELREQDIDTIWRDLESITSEDTHYAGPGQELKRSRARLIGDGKRPIMCNDNEFSRAFPDGTVHVLMGDGQIREITLREMSEKYGWEPADDEEPIPIGPDSPHPLLQQLEP